MRRNSDGNRQAGRGQAYCRLRKQMHDRTVREVMLQMSEAWGSFDGREAMEEAEGRQWSLKVYYPECYPRWYRQGVQANAPRDSGHLRGGSNAG